MSTEVVEDSDKGNVINKNLENKCISNTYTYSLLLSLMIVRFKTAQ